MPFTLNRDMTQGPQDRMWRFHGTQTREGSDVVEMFDQPLPHDTVVRVFRDEMGAVPGIGLGRDEVVENWERLEPRLRAEIARLLPDAD
ncbi:MAG TPA: hypothetical protein VOA64_09405 [Candidatus Dormibacteraeota bacterium]|nr:hypothetical protein [Candidatus Dormibacteraeota bacterium]